ncbi:MAG: MscL family protein, partial [Bacteroidales bacterium]|nr:MscL family protein [Bacteroidales bacterium]
TSLVNDIIMPLLGVLIGGVNFSELRWTLREATETATAVTVNYGNFIQVAIDFLLVALTLFFVIKAFTKLSNIRSKKEETK